MTNEIRKENYNIYADGLETLRGKDAQVWILPEVGILAPAGMTIPVKASHEEMCHVTKDGIIDSRLIAMECNVKGNLKCTYDDETGAYYWVRSEELLKKMLREAAGLG